MTRAAVLRHRMTREGVRELFETIYGLPIPALVTQKLAGAEKIRDKIMHGKTAKESETRKALAEVFDYAEALNQFTEQQSGFKPFDDLRGFKGRAQALDKSTTRWLLKGLGLDIA